MRKQKGLARSKFSEMYSTLICADNFNRKMWDHMSEAEQQLAVKSMHDLLDRIEVLLYESKIVSKDMQRKMDHCAEICEDWDHVSFYVKEGAK